MVVKVWCSYKVVEIRVVPSSTNKNWVNLYHILVITTHWLHLHRTKIDLSPSQ